MVSFDSKTYSKKLLHLISWSHWFTLFNIGAAILFSSFYIIGESLPETSIGLAYLLTTWLSHMAFLTFFTFVLIVFPLTLLFPRTKFIRITASIVFTIGLLLLVLDAFIYSRLGYHLNASSYQQIFELIASQIDEYGFSFYVISLMLFLFILAFELTVSNYAWKHLQQLQKTQFARKIIIVLVAAFFFSHITHIWADAKLDYDVLQQDTILPLSYPLTAKTLLTKYDLFDRKDYLSRRNKPLNFTKTVPDYPIITNQCDSNLVKQSVFMVLTDNYLSARQIKNFQQRASNNYTLTLTHHIDNALSYDSAWFNLLYSLPSIYQEAIMDQQTPPVLFQALKHKSLDYSYTQISAQNTNQKVENLVTTLFDDVNVLANSASLLLAEKLNNYNKGLHIFYFKDKDSFQFELFMDALLLAQQQKHQKDIIWISALGNKNINTSLLVKQALLLWDKKSARKKTKRITLLTSQMDVMPTLLQQWLGCDLRGVNYTVGADLLTLKKARVIANTVENGLMVFNKDKAVFIDQNGNFQSYSSQLQAPIMESADFPLMIDGVRFIKKFTANKEKVQLSTEP